MLIKITSLLFIAVLFGLATSPGYSDDIIACSGFESCPDANVGNFGNACTIDGPNNCCLSDEDCSQDLCDRAECNETSNRCGNDPVVCNPSNLCNVSECSSNDGECDESPIVCDDGFECNPDNGDCELVCPCFSEAILLDLGTIIPGECGDNFPFAGIAAVFYTNDSAACSGSGGCGTANPSCGYDDAVNGISVGSGPDPISEEQDTACRLLIANVCPQAATTEDAQRLAPQYSLPILSNQ